MIGRSFTSMNLSGVFALTPETHKRLALFGLWRDAYFLSIRSSIFFSIFSIIVPLAFQDFELVPMR